MEKYSFFNSEIIEGNYDRTYRAEDFADYFSSFVGNGVFGGGVNSLKAVQTGEDYVTVMPGKAFINGYYYENTENLNVYFGSSDTKILLRLDLNQRMIYITTGTELVRNQNIYDLQLATIESGVVYDNRFNRDVCGTVVAAVQEINVDSVYEEFKQRFEDILDSVDDSGILASISDLQTDVRLHGTEINQIKNNFEWKTLVSNRSVGDGYPVNFPQEWKEIKIVASIPINATNRDLVTAELIYPMLANELKSGGRNVVLSGSYETASTNTGINLRYEANKFWVSRVARNGTWYNTEDVQGYGAIKWSAYYR